MIKLVFWIRATITILMAFVFYPIIYVFGFLMSIPCGINPHKSAIRSINKFNEVFE